MRSLKTLLTVVGAVTVLVLASNTLALAATGHALILGKKNTANKMTKLKRTTAGPALKLKTTSSSATPLKVNGRGKVANLNADLLDGKDSTEFAPYPKVIRGNWVMGTTAAAADASLVADISFGWTLPGEPIAHFIAPGDPVPAGCSGSVAAPNASPGHLCVFQGFDFGDVRIGVCNVNNDCPGADRFGAILYGYTEADGIHQAAGTWAVRPASVSASRIKPGARVATSSGDPGGR